MSTPYTITEPHVYIIHDRPDESSPSERIQQDGGEALRIQELLEALLEIDARSVPQLQEYGSRALTSLHTVGEIKKTLGLTEAQATKLLAALHLGKRLYAPATGTLVTVRGIEDVYMQYRVMATLSQEQLRVLIINSRYQIIHEEIVAIGGVDTLHILARDVLQSAAERRAGAIILVHNHPSGDPTPSAHDLAFTRKIQQAGEVLDIQLLDHVIVTEAGYVSCMP